MSKINPLSPISAMYRMISGHLEGLVEHVDLWNHNVEFLEQETPFPTPAVFVEFHPIAWEPVKERIVRGTMRITLHVVTEWHNSPYELDELIGLTDQIAARLHGCGSGFAGPLALSETQINHNHEELVETLETYACRVSRVIPPFRLID